MRRYETEVDVQTADGETRTYSGDGVGPADLTPDQVLDSAEAAALAQEPGGTVTGSRYR